MSMATFSSCYSLHLLSSLTYSSCSTFMIASLNVTGTTSLSHQHPRKPQLLSPSFHCSATFGPRIKLQPPNLYTFLKGDPVPCDQYADNGFIFYSREKPSGRSFTVQSSSSLNEIEELFSKPLEGRELDLEQYSAVPFPSIKAAKRVVLVRHGQSTWNEEGRIQGSSNFSVLTKKGESQAETSRVMLIDDSFDVCFTSPLIRSKRTAEIIWGTRKEEMITDVELREIDLYSFQGLLKHEGKSKFGAAFCQWQVDPSNFIIDGHYPVRDLWARARTCWNKILAHDSKSVLVVAHNAINQALVATAIGLGTKYFRIFLQSNCSVSVLDFNPRLEGGSPFVCLNRLNQVTQQVMFCLNDIETYNVDSKFPCG